MAVREGNWWSRAWGVVAVAAFVAHLGGAIYEAAVVAPLWSLAPPKSVTSWVTLANRPDSSALFHPLVAIIAVAAAMSWTSGILTRGWRRWWLTLMLVAAGGLVAITVMLIVPAERQLFGLAAREAAKSGAEAAWIIGTTNDWIRAAALRFVVLFVGTWSAYRAQLAGMLVDRPLRVVARADDEDEPFVLAGDTPRRGGRGRRARDFAFGDEVESEDEGDEEGADPREAWRGSLPRRRRTAKK